MLVADNIFIAFINTVVFDIIFNIFHSIAIF